MSQRFVRKGFCGGAVLGGDTASGAQVHEILVRRSSRCENRSELNLEVGIYIDMIKCINKCKQLTK